MIPMVKSLARVEILGAAGRFLEIAKNAPGCIIGTVVIWAISVAAPP
jgi:hypothetical protein